MIKSFVNGLEKTKPLEVVASQASKEKLEKLVDNLKNTRGSHDFWASKYTKNIFRISFQNCLKIMLLFSVKFYFCELLNVLNIMFQLYFTDFFLKGYFAEVATGFLKSGENVLTNTVFPLTATCEPFKL